MIRCHCVVNSLYVSHLSLFVYYSTSSARYHTRPCMHCVNKIICPVSSDCLLCREGTHESRHFYNIEWSPNSKAWARSLVGGGETPGGLGMGWGSEESFVRREREEVQIVNSHGAWVRAALSSSSQTCRSRAYIQPGCSGCRPSFNQQGPKGAFTRSVNK